MSSASTAAAPSTAAVASSASSAAPSSSLPAPSGPLLARLGILSDIQYADHDDGHNFLRTEQRFYRHARIATARAIDRMRGTVDPEWRCDAVLHLGDLIDGVNAIAHHSGEHYGEAAVAEILQVLPPITEERVIAARTAEAVAPASAAPASSTVATSSAASSSAASAPAPAPAAAAPLPCYHLLGNHEVVNLPRSRWATILGFGALSAASRAEAALRERQREKEMRHKPKSAEDEAAAEKQYMFPTKTQDPLVSVPAQQKSTVAAATASSSAAPAVSASAAAPAAAVYPSTTPFYYDLTLGSGRFRFLMLDSFDLSVSGYDDCEASDPLNHAVVAREWLRVQNPNAIKYSPEGLVGTERRKVAFNGGMGSAQIKWARNVLLDARTKGQSAVLLSHVAFHSGCASNSALLWNRQELLDLVSEFASDTVVACLHGHDHDGGHVVDSQGVVHHTIEGLLTTPEGADTYGRMDLFADRIRVWGVDRMKGFDIPLDKQQRMQNRTEDWKPELFVLKPLEPAPEDEEEEEDQQNNAAAAAAAPQTPA